MTQHTPIPSDELEMFNSLPDIKVVFDVGARADNDYLKLKPDIELHAFEPYPEFFEQLKESVGDNPKAHLNNFGLGDYEGTTYYHEGRQSFVGSEEPTVKEGRHLLQVRKLDDYVREHNIQQIDFLKIDTEGYDFKVLLGGLETIPKCRYIQYEHWNDLRRFHILLGQNFEMTYTGHRNVLCKRLWQ